MIKEPCRQGDAAKVAAKVAALFELHSWRAANHDSRAHLRVALRAAHLGAGHVTDVARAAPAMFAPAAERSGLRLGGPPVQRPVQLVVDVAVEPLEARSVTQRFADGTLPVVSVGDYNTSKFSTYAATYLPKMKAAGYGDVLGQTYATPLSRPRAAIVDRAWVNSFNGYRRDARVYSYEDAQNKIGTNTTGSSPPTRCR